MTEKLTFDLHQENLAIRYAFMVLEIHDEYQDDTLGMRAKIDLVKDLAAHSGVPWIKVVECLDTTSPFEETE